MTAEIAIINRTAVALAADSAATLTSSAGMKANNNADKLFHLCASESVGLMIFGNAEFMEIPLEPVVKGFRAGSRASTRQSIEEYADAFFDFLEKDLPISDYASRAHLVGIATALLAALFRTAMNRVFQSSSNKRQNFQTTFAQFLLEEIHARTALVVKIDNCVNLDSIDKTLLSGQVTEVCNEVLTTGQYENMIQDVAIRNKIAAALSALMVHSLVKNDYSTSSTGLVIAGFGAADIFPSICVYETEGVIGGRVKRKMVKKISIDPSASVRGHIESFAQSDVVQRYTEGLDPKLRNLITEKLHEAVKGYGEALADEWFGSNKRKKADAIVKAGAAAKNVVDSFLDEVLEKATQEEKRDITSVVNYMSKAELAQLAEALVEMTALRRRVSMDIETVGGPIDVAVISRGDGFVWVKRKHYFDIKLNPRYALGKQSRADTRSNGHAKSTSSLGT